MYYTKFLNQKSLKFKLNLVIITIMLLMLVSVLFSINNIVRREVALEKLHTDINIASDILDREFPGAWRLEGDRLYKGHHLINGNYMVDYIGRLLGGGAISIIANDTKVATNITINGKRALNNQITDKLSQSLLSEERTYLEQNIEGVNYQNAYIPLEDSSGNIVATLEVGVAEDMMDHTIKSIFFSISTILLIGIILVLSLLTLSINKLIFNPLNKILKVSTKVGDGDFSKRLNMDKEDIIGKLGDGINLMINNLSTIINHIKKTCSEANLNSQQISASSQEASASSQEVSAQIQDFNVKINDLNQVASNINESSQKVNKLANDGLNNMISTEEEMKNILTTSKSSINHIDSLNKSSKKIKEITELISSLAEETDLLALNASIEAARAGEHGHGFAVVASEVKSLAQDTQKSVNNVQEIIKEFTTIINLIITNLKDNNSQIKQGAAKLAKTKINFEVIVDKINEVTNKVEKISFISEGISNGSKEISSAVQNQTGSAEEIASSIQELTTVLSNLESTIAKFKTN
ncbi:methyl-accepting chemotaxis protein [Halonatronum saccharophilum]|uniref:methyl-accepting chemotaxis protein n=1 Tax=Halonatronum saccharophilum TaxID=150060 RepID=UPI00048748CC|nr:methyl-accepting chemotaxis protein [Halonatronum saccharophilum]